MKWRDLESDKPLLEALDRAGPRPADTEPQTVKKIWSKAFADACAVMLANELRRGPALRKFNIYPSVKGEKIEALSGTRGQGRGKQVDVAVTSEAYGLQLALSLKGVNFRDPKGHYGKNPTGRLYEIQDETQKLHEYHPHAFLVGVYYLPLGAVMDMKTRSTFAKLVGMLRARTGRDDPLFAPQVSKLEWSVVALYVQDDGSPQRGVCRYFDVNANPPKLGRPRVETTMSLVEFVAKAMELRSHEESPIEYVDPESDD